jgi:hypothetical protein
MTGDPRQTTRLCPPAVAIHDDGDVLRSRSLVGIGGQRRSGHQTVLISFSLLASASSTSFT